MEKEKLIKKIYELEDWDGFIKRNEVVKLIKEIRGENEQK